MSIRIWFLIQQFMIRNNLVERPPSDYIHCRRCSTRVALVEDYILTENDVVTAGFFNRLFNVEVSEDERHHRVIDGKTLAETYCIQCTNLLGWKLIAMSQPSRNYREGGFYMRLDELIYWNGVTLIDFLSGGDNDQDGGADEEQDHDQNGGANEQNADQNGDANEQDLGANEQNADQDGDANEQDLGANEQNADQNVDANEQVPSEQDLGSNEQNADQDVNGGVNEPVAYQDKDIAEGMGNIDLNANI